MVEPQFSLDFIRRYRRQWKRPSAAELQQRETKKVEQAKIEQFLITFRQSQPRDLSPGKVGNPCSVRAQQVLAHTILTLLERGTISDLTLLKGEEDDDVLDVIVVSGKIAGKTAFVYKASTDIQQITHEAVVGLFATNPLREFIPNFSYLYGFLEAPYPLIKGERVTLSSLPESKRPPAAAVIYEYVPGASLWDACSDITAEDFICVYLEILLSLQVAFEFCRFSHGDLYPTNVILRPVARDSVIRYPTQDEVFYCRTNGLMATFIDYETAYFEAKSPGGDITTFSGARDHSFIINDAYRVLIWSLKRMREKKNPDAPLLATLVRYFNREDNLELFIDAAPPAEPTPNNLRLTLPSLISFVKGWMLEYEIANPLSSSPPKGELLSCDE